MQFAQKLHKIEISEWLRKNCKEGECLPPWYYGLAYREWNSYAVVFYPIPFNYLVRFAMVIHHKWNRFRSRLSWVDRQVIAEIERKTSALDAQRFLYEELIHELVTRRRAAPHFHGITDPATHLVGGSDDPSMISRLERLKKGEKR